MIRVRCNGKQKEALRGERAPRRSRSERGAAHARRRRRGAYTRQKRLHAHLSRQPGEGKNERRILGELRWELRPDTAVRQEAREKLGGFECDHFSLDLGGAAPQLVEVAYAEALCVQAAPAAKRGFKVSGAGEAGLDARRRRDARALRMRPAQGECRSTGALRRSQHAIRAVGLRRFLGAERLSSIVRVVYERRRAMAREERRGGARAALAVQRRAEANGAAARLGALVKDVRGSESNCEQDSRKM
jgi:hypothetical protein